MIKITYSTKARRKTLVSTLGYLLTVYDGDEAAMYAAIAEHRANPTKYAVKSPSIDPIDRQPMKRPR